MLFRRYSTARLLGMMQQYDVTLPGWEGYHEYYASVKAELNRRGAISLERLKRRQTFVPAPGYYLELSKLPRELRFLADKEEYTLLGG